MIDNIEYILYNNSKTEKFLNDYRFSSYLDWLEITRPENKIINKAAYPYFETQKEFNDYLQDLLAYPNEA